MALLKNTKDRAELIPWYVCNQKTIDDPYSNYEAFRAVSPVYYKQERNEWFLVDYDPICRILRDPSIFSSNRRIDLAPNSSDNNGANLVLLSDDPPIHGYRRGLVGHWFTNYSVKTLRPFVESLVDQIIEESFSGPIDFAQAVAVPVPVMVAAKLIGVDPADWQKLSFWSQVGVGSKAMDTKASYQMFGYFREAIRKKRKQPGEDLISHLVSVEGEGGPLNDIEVLKFCILLLTAGSETTSNLLGNMFNFLALRNDLWRQLSNQTHTIEAFINEMLHNESPIQFFSRVVTKTTSLDGYTFTKGSTMILCAGAANRDPKIFLEPHTFKIERPTAKKHLAFSYGIHYCIGAAMAKMEVSVVLDALLKRFSTMLRAGKAKRLQNTTIRGFSHLPLRFE